jgi:hypothetical protein
MFNIMHVRNFVERCIVASIPIRALRLKMGESVTNNVKFISGGTTTSGRNFLPVHLVHFGTVGMFSTFGTF